VEVFRELVFIYHAYIITYCIIQLMPALKVNIIIVHPRGVVFPRAKHLKGEQL
jgi:hypothetical protein